jgi:pimeloyl-ACP methyl ester carboxylesterase
MEDKEQKQLLNSYGDRFALETLLNNVTAQPLVNSDMENAVSDNLRASHASWNWWIELGSQENISAQVSTVKVHVLIISGKADPKFSTSFLREKMLTYFPLASFAEIKNAGHLLPIETPLDIAKAIDEFIVKHDKSSRL